MMRGVDEKGRDAGASNVLTTGRAAAARATPLPQFTRPLLSSPPSTSKITPRTGGLPPPPPPPPLAEAAASASAARATVDVDVCCERALCRFAAATVLQCPLAADADDDALALVFARRMVVVPSLCHRDPGEGERLPVFSLWSTIWSLAVFEGLCGQIKVRVALKSNKKLQLSHIKRGHRWVWAG